MHFCFDLDLLLFVDKMVCICPNALVGKLHFWSLISMTKIVFVPHFFLLNKKHFEIINWRHTAFEFTVKNQRSTLTELVCVIK